MSKYDWSLKLYSKVNLPRPTHKRKQIGLEKLHSGTAGNDNVLGHRFTSHDRPQLPATIDQLHSTTRPTSASRNDRPAAFNDSTDLSFPQRSSSCIQRLDRPQLPATIDQPHSTTRPTSASRYVHLAVSPRLDLHQLPSSSIQLRTSTTRPYHLSISPI